MTYKFQRNIPSFIPAIIFVFVTWVIFSAGFLCGKLCEDAKAKKQKERQIFLEKETHRIA
jgi:hypothetical protein